MADKYRLHIWIDDRADAPLTVDQVRRRLHQALNSIGDTHVNVACEGPIREDHGR